MKWKRNFLSSGVKVNDREEVGKVGPRGLDLIPDQSGKPPDHLEGVVVEKVKPIQSEDVAKPGTLDVLAMAVKKIVLDLIQSKGNVFDFVLQIRSTLIIGGLIILGIAVCLLVIKLIH